MKKFILFFVAALCIIASCSKDSGFGPESGLSPSLIKGYPVCPPVIVVPPDQDGDGDDTDDLLAAVSSAAPGSVIKLTEGIYHVGSLEIFGFEGSFVGAGKDKTIILPSGLIKSDEQLARNLMPAWWRIIGGNVTITDLTFKTGDGALQNLQDPFYNKILLSLLTINNYNVDYPYDSQPMNFFIKNVNFICGSLDQEDGYLGTLYNVLMPLWIGMDYWVPIPNIPLTRGKYDIVNCYFENSYEGPEFFSLGENATGTMDRIRTYGCGMGIYCTANFNSKIYLTNNVFTNSLINDVFIEDNDWGLISNTVPFKRCLYVVTGNTFNSSPGISSLVFKDSWGLIHPDKYQPILAMVKNNMFTLAEGSTGVSCLNSIDPQVMNNRFTGTSSTGVYIDGAMVYDPLTYEELGTGWAKNALLLGNNFTGLNATTADIVLGENSKNCTVVGNGKESVVDYGTNNIIVGMKRKPYDQHFGLTIRDNFRMWHRSGHH
jgi:hypothetical protein